MKKARVLRSWSKHNLPEELWPEILSRLPVKSLLRFRCVSRSWKVLIDDPDFVRLHLNRFNNRHQAHLFFVQGGSYECVVKNSKTLRTSFSLGFLQSDPQSLQILRTTAARGGLFRRWSIVSSIEGLFMLNSTWTSDLMLWNPSIRKTLTLPHSPQLSPFSTDVDFGLGFDPLIKDYKFVRFVLIPKKGVQFAAVYTLGTNSWKAVDIQGERQDFIFHYGRRSIPLNGVIYDLAKDESLNPLELVSFDLRSELLASFELPVTDEQPMYHRALTLIDDGSSLALVSLSKSNVSLCVLERLEDDIKSWSWIQRCIFPTPDSYDPWDIRFLCLKKNGEMLLKCCKKVMCYNLETREEKLMLEKNKKNFHQGSAVPYMESLILHYNSFS